MDGDEDMVQFVGVNGLKAFLSFNNLGILQSSLIDYCGLESLEAVSDAFESKAEMREALKDQPGIKLGHINVFYARLKRHLGLPEQSLMQRSMNQSAIEQGFLSSTLSSAQLDVTGVSPNKPNVNISETVENYSRSKGLSSAAAVPRYSSNSNDVVVKYRTSGSSNHLFAVQNSIPDSSPSRLVADVCSSNALNVGANSDVRFPSSNGINSSISKTKQFVFDGHDNSNQVVSTNGTVLCNSDNNTVSSGAYEKCPAYSEEVVVSSDSNCLAGPSDYRDSSPVDHNLLTSTQCKQTFAGSIHNTPLSEKLNNTDHSVEPHSTDLNYSIAGVALERFGISKLQQFQIDSVRSCVQGKNVVIVQPTGSGKSLSFQMLPLLVKKPVVVIVPTVALMMAHVESATRSGLSAAMIGGGQTANINLEIEQKFRNNEIQLLFVTPEYVFCNNERFMEETLRPMCDSSDIAAVAVDEMHCCTDWANFRSAYDNLHEIKNLQNTPIMLLTATIRPEQLEQLINRLLPIDRELYRSVSSINRPNIKLEVLSSQKSLNPSNRTIQKAGGNEAYYGYFADIIVTRAGTNKAIVYQDNKNACKQLSICLTNRGITAKYIVGTDSQSLVEKTNIIKEWTAGNIQVIVATTAFGLGVNLLNVRFVFRFGFAPSICELVQEFGRAGRDGKLAHGIMITYDSDQYSSASLFLRSCKTDIDRENASNNLNEVCGFGSTDTCLRAYLLDAFGESDCRTCLERGEELCARCAQGDNNINNKVDSSDQLYVLMKSMDELNNLAAFKTILYVTGSNDKKIADIRRGLMFGSGTKFHVSQEWWALLIARALGLKFLKMTFYPNIQNAYQPYCRLSLTDLGRYWMNNKTPIMLDMTIVNDNSNTPKVKTRNVGVKQELKVQMSDRSCWFDMSQQHEQQYPGVSRTENGSVLFIKDATQIQLNGDISASGLFNEIQFKKGKYNKRVYDVDMESNDLEDIETVNCQVISFKCGGLKVCSNDECKIVNSARMFKNKCNAHPTNSLISTEHKYGECNVSISVIAPTAPEDNRRWIVSSGGIESHGDDGYFNLHNHPHPGALDLHVPPSVSKQIRNAAALNNNLSTHNLISGIGQTSNPTLQTSALTTRHVIDQRRQARIAHNSSLLYTVRQFNAARQNDILGAYRPACILYQHRHEIMKQAIPYVRDFTHDGEQFQFVHTQSPAHSQMINSSKMLQIDVTVNESHQLPYLFHGVSFCQELDRYVSVFKFRALEETSEMYDLAFKHLNKVLQTDCPGFQWEEMQVILVDWSSTQMAALYRFLGKDLAEDLIKGCKVHFQRCIRRASFRCVAELFRPIYVHIGYGITRCDNEEDVKLGLLVLTGAEQFASLFEITAYDGIRELVIDLGGHESIETIADNKKWGKWWQSDKNVKALINSKCGPSDTNGLEGANAIVKQDINGKAGPLQNRLTTVYLKDLIHISNYTYAILNPNVSFAQHSSKERLNNTNRMSKTRKLQKRAAANSTEVEEDDTLPPPVLKKVKH